MQVFIKLLIRVVVDGVKALIGVGKGLGITMLNFWRQTLGISKAQWDWSKLTRPHITLQYPKEQPILPDGYRGSFALLYKQAGDEGEERCNGCTLCATVCPCRCIYIKPGKVDGRRIALEYYIDLSLCMYCGLCVEACPQTAIVHTKEFELSTYSPKQLLLDKNYLLEVGRRLQGLPSKSEA